MQEPKSIHAVQWPEINIDTCFSFGTSHKDGVFYFNFKWLNGRWNCWVTLPSGAIRQAGVYPNVISWSEFNDYGIVFTTRLTEINLSSITLTEIGIISWN